MNILTPIAFALTALLPVIVALYFLKLRREEQVVSSIYLWQEMVRDVAANAPWQRLRPNLLLLLQLLFLAALILALARPFSWTMAASGDHLILVVDRSASMAATDVQPDRLTGAAEQARRLVADLPPDVPVTLILAGSQVEIPLSSSTDRERLDVALRGESLHPDSGSADLTTALELAGAIAAGEPAAQIAVLSDGGARLPDRMGLPATADLRYLPIGQSGETQAVSALSLDPGAAGQGWTAFVRVTNYGPQEVQRRLALYAYSAGERHLATVRDLSIPPQESVGLTVPDLPPETIALEAALQGADPLPLDDRGWAVTPILSGAQIQIVGPGNRFLETALALLPGVEVTTISLADYETTVDDELEEPAGHWLTIFDTVLPESGRYPPGALLFVGPLHSTTFFSVTGRLDQPLLRPATTDEPLLRHVDLRDIVVEEAARLALPDWGRPVVLSDGPTGDGAAPLLMVGEAEGHRLAVLAFDLRRSDLPLRVAFPLLLANLVDFLAPGTSGSVPETVTPGQPVAIPLPPLADAAVVTRPDGARERLTPQDGAVLFADTAAPGLYEVAWEMGGEAWPLGRFAVNLASPLESDIAPREHLPLAGSGGPGVAAERPAREEWWRWLAWAGLALLLVEWLVQHRGRLAWVWSRRELLPRRRSG